MQGEQALALRLERQQVQVVARQEVQPLVQVAQPRHGRVNLSRPAPNAGNIPHRQGLVERSETERQPALVPPVVRSDESGRNLRPGLDFLQQAPRARFQAFPPDQGRPVPVAQKLQVAPDSRLVLDEPVAGLALGQAGHEHKPGSLPDPALGVHGEDRCDVPAVAVVDANLTGRVARLTCPHEDAATALQNQVQIDDDVPQKLRHLLPRQSGAGRDRGGRGRRRGSQDAQAADTGQAQAEQVWTAPPKGTGRVLHAVHSPTTDSSHSPCRNGHARGRTSEDAGRSGEPLAPVGGR